jgi:hypothetical protein
MVKKKKRASSSKKNLTLSFLTYSEIQKLSSVNRVKKILDIALKNRIVLLQGKLNPDEEASLIQSTMALIGRVKNFKGVEIEVITPGQQSSFFSKMKTGLAHALVGQRDILTIVGPASIVKSIKKDPSKIDLMLNK